MDKIKTCKELGAKLLFVGNDWYGTEKWKDYEKRCELEDIQVIYFPYTKGVSSTQIKKALDGGHGFPIEIDGTA